MEKEKFKIGMMLLSVSLPPFREIAQATVDSWHVLFGMWPDKQWQDAVEYCLKTCEFFPAPCKLFEWEGKIDLENHELGKQASSWFEDVWQTRSYSPTVGAYFENGGVKRKVGDNEIYQAYLEAGGATAFNEALSHGSESLPFLRKAFVASYVARRRASKVDEYLGLGKRVAVEPGASEAVQIPDRVKLTDESFIKAPPDQAEANRILKTIEKVKTKMKERKV